MSTGAVVARDRVLPGTRVLSVVIIPFLLVAFVVLYFWPSADDTARLFAWRIVPGSPPWRWRRRTSAVRTSFSGPHWPNNGTRSAGASFPSRCSPR